MTETPFSYINAAYVDFGIKSLFTGIDSSSNTAVSSTQLIYSFMSFLFICSFILLSLLMFFFFKSIAWNLLSRIPFPFLFPFPDSGLHVLVLPIYNAYAS